ncbi:hypothetical protein J5N97_001876 [Dioscorea zingiberensis]|uniref:Uncharacterized protein n=1 Tax=Dioscorea zingiberensis TaxID=325984 RepID=A0A9D5BTL2_9LILI|nr:hypothetical protein J5N97_001876 [Dioscorea zingiberensis]
MVSGGDEGGAREKGDTTTARTMRTEEGEPSQVPIDIPTPGKTKLVVPTGRQDTPPSRNSLTAHGVGSGGGGKTWANVVQGEHMDSVTYPGESGIHRQSDNLCDLRRVESEGGDQHVPNKAYARDRSTISRLRPVEKELQGRWEKAVAGKGNCRGGFARGSHDPPYDLMGGIGNTGLNFSLLEAHENDTGLDQSKPSEHTKSPKLNHQAPKPGWTQSSHGRAPRELVSYQDLDPPRSSNLDLFENRGKELEDEDLQEEEEPVNMMTSLREEVASPSAKSADQTRQMILEKEEYRGSGNKEHIALATSVAEALNVAAPMKLNNNGEESQQLDLLDVQKKTKSKKKVQDKEGSGGRLIDEIRKIKKGRIGKQSLKKAPTIPN